MEELLAQGNLVNWPRFYFLCPWKLTQTTGRVSKYEPCNAKDTGVPWWLGGANKVFKDHGADEEGKQMRQEGSCWSTSWEKNLWEVGQAGCTAKPQGGSRSSSGHRVMKASKAGGGPRTPWKTARVPLRAAETVNLSWSWSTGGQQCVRSCKRETRKNPVLLQTRRWNPRFPSFPPFPESSQRLQTLLYRKWTVSKKDVGVKCTGHLTLTDHLLKPRVNKPHLRTPPQGALLWKVGGQVTHITWPHMDHASQAVLQIGKQTNTDFKWMP